ncbi:28823_t:CDS:1, partial [Racocetra persica]
ESSFETLSHNREEANNLDVISVKVGDPFEDFEHTEEYIQ